jgi:hypothetical protein
MVKQADSKILSELSPAATPSEPSIEPEPSPESILLESSLS